MMPQWTFYDAHHFSWIGDGTGDGWVPEADNYGRTGTEKNPVRCMDEGPYLCEDASYERNNHSSGLGVEVPANGFGCGEGEYGDRNGDSMIW